MFKMMDWIEWVGQEYGNVMVERLEDIGRSRGGKNGFLTVISENFEGYFVQNRI